MILQMLPNVVSSRVAARVVGTNTGDLHRPAASQGQRMTDDGTFFAFVNRDDPNPGIDRTGRRATRSQNRNWKTTRAKAVREPMGLSTRFTSTRGLDGQVSSCCSPPQQPTVRFRRMQQLLLLISEGVVAVLTPARVWHRDALGSCWVHPRVAWALTIFPVDLGCLRVANPWERPHGRPGNLGKDRGSLFGCFLSLLRTKYCQTLPTHPGLVELPSTAFALDIGTGMIVFVNLCMYLLLASQSILFHTRPNILGRDCWWKNPLRASRSMLIK